MGLKALLLKKSATQNAESPCLMFMLPNSFANARMARGIMHTQNTITISRSILISLAFCCKQIMSLRNVKLLLLMEFVLARIRELCFLIVETIAAYPAAVMSNGTITRVAMKQVWRRLCRTPGHFRTHFRSLSIFSTSIRNDTGKPTAK